MLITDGISGPLTAKEVVDTIHSKLRGSLTSKLLLTQLRNLLFKPNAKLGARHLVDSALHLGSQDNCTAVVIPLGAWGKYKSPATTHRRQFRHFIASPGRY